MYWNRVTWLLVLLLLPFMQLQAAESQQEEPIYIESDSLRIDDTQGISTYKGNVVFRQGPDTLKADKLVIHTDENQEVQKIVATGTPAHFEHDDITPEEKSWGQAQTIEYHAAESLMILSGDARFEQGDNQFSGNRIEYEQDKKLVRAGKNVAGEGRVKIIIHPHKNGADQQTQEQQQE